jgi:tetratricopeptide (TPR) repeat protein
MVAYSRMASEFRYRGVIIALAGLLLLQIAGAAIWYRWFRHDAQESSGVIPRMQELTRERRYDEAVQIGQSALKNISADDGVLQQIALVYLRRAQIETGDKTQFTGQAVDYSEKALAAKPANQLDFYATARVLDIAGDYSVTLRCEHYERSVSLFEKRLQFLTGESVEVEGKTVPTVQLRQENDYLLQRVKAKMAKAGCE